MQNLVHGARLSPLTDFSQRIGPFLVRQTLEKWAMSRLTMIFCQHVNLNDQNETYLVKEIASIFSQTINSICLNV